MAHWSVVILWTAISLNGFTAAITVPGETDNSVSNKEVSNRWLLPVLPTPGLYTKIVEIQPHEEINGKPVLDLSLPNVNMYRNGITFLRELLALLMSPATLTDPGIFKSDIRDRADFIRSSDRGYPLGIYTDPRGIPAIRKHVASYLERRDDRVSDYNRIFLTNGGVDAIKDVFSLLSNPAPEDGRRFGILIPSPIVDSHALVSKSVGLDFEFYRYDLNFDSGKWALRSNRELIGAYLKLSKRANVKALLIVNPSNPTGRLFSSDELAKLLTFAQTHNLTVVSDEVHHPVIVNPKRKILSTRRVAKELGSPYDAMEIYTIIAATKGALSETGMRGGAFEMLNIRQDLVDFQGIVASNLKFCPNSAGQITIEVLTNPPAVGDESFEKYQEEINERLNSFRRNLKRASRVLGSLPNMTVNQVEATPFLFPHVTLSFEEDDSPGMDYVNGLQKEQGVMVMPGELYNVEKGKLFFRLFLMVPDSIMQDALRRIKDFHLSFIERYQYK